MYSNRGRGGPSRSTPANVLCQKCLKRGHYSYECKVPAQERPYTSRPSRSQQLRNPKLIPKLTNDALKPLEDKKGVADEELAKREAERARKREAEEREDRALRSDTRHRRSPSTDSVSTISTAASADSRRKEEHARNRSADTSSRSRHLEDRRSRSPQSSRSPGRDSLSPPPENSKRSYRDRDTRAPRDSESDQRSKRRRYSEDSKSSHGLDRHSEPRHFSRDHRDPGERHIRSAQNPGTRSRGGFNDRGGRRHENDVGEGRERSLSPFSKRKAMARGRG